MIAKWIWRTAVAAVLAGLLCSAWGGLVRPDNAPLWLSLSVMVFPLMAVLTVLVAIIEAWRRKWVSVAVLFAALLMCLPMLRITFPMNLVVSSTDGQPQLKVLALNAQYFEQQDTDAPNATLQYVLNSGADVVMLQEVTHDGWGTPYEVTDTTFTPVQIAQLDSIYPYRSHDNDDVGIMSRYPFTRVELARPIVGFDMVDYYVAMQHHYVVAYDLYLPDGRQLRMVGVHLRSWSFSRHQRAMLGGELAGEMDAMPGSDAYGLSTTQLIRRAYAARVDEAQTVRRALDDCPHNMILCGDFNDVPGSWVYRTVCGGDMHDAWADAGRGYAHTFNKYRFLLRIDHILYRGDLRPVDIHRDKGGASDHYPQIVTFEWR